MRVPAIFSAGVILLATHVLGCGSDGARPGEVEGTRFSRAAVQRGCRTVCAPCAPHTVCPHRCKLACPAAVVPCGSVVCSGGDVCCNESCGICTPPGGACTQQVCAPGSPCVETALCIRGFQWSPRQCACVPDLDGAPQDQCSSDADCRLFSDYCTGCDCRSLAVDDPDPSCTGPGVRCFADPCFGKTAVCVAGQCIESPRDLRGRVRPRGPHPPHPPHAPHAPGHPAG
jgi:hypothetical protein